MVFGSGIPEIERGGLRQAAPFAWQCDTSIARNSWCYTDQLQYKSVRHILLSLIHVVCRNGNLLLNVGSKGDGSIPERDREILEEIGDWRRVNGEAVYKSRPWKIVGEGKTREPEGSFTDSEDGQVLIRSMGIPGAPSGEGVFFGRIRSVSILGSEEKPFWRQEKDGLHVRTCAVKSHLPVVAKVQVL